MTLTQQNRQRLAGYCNDYRRDWESALTADGILKLDREHPDDELLVAALTIAAARNPKANGPAFMLGKPEAVDGPVVPAVTLRPTPRPTDPECPVCCSQLRDDQGRCVGCRQDAARPTVPRAASKPYQTPSPPPAGNRERIAALIEANRTPVEANVPNRNQEG